MNGLIRRRFCSLYVQCRSNAFDKANKLTSISCQENHRQFSSEDGKKDVYIPRRIKKRLKEKNLKVEDYEIVPVFKDKSKHDSVERMLNDAIISDKDPVLDAEFPSDIDYQIKGGVIKDTVPESKAKKPKPYIDPKDRSVLLFPGQGSQIVGMGRKLLPYPGVTEMYQKASEILGYDLLNICLNGPKTQLDKTEFCQPAVFVTSLAGVERLKEDIPEVKQGSY